MRDRFGSPEARKFGKDPSFFQTDVAAEGSEAFRRTNGVAFADAERLTRDKHTQNAGRKWMRFNLTSQNKKGGMEDVILLASLNTQLCCRTKVAMSHRRHLLPLHC